ncbi:MAG: pectate lyase [Muribaculaceae bacterium]|nr:pectate lyase [Muribaculaceae bacterium]
MKKSTLLIAAAMAAFSLQAATPAFPGAEGFGRYTTGGRGGKVVHVTNLDDDGPGSLRAALSGTAKKTIVFDVSGYIDLKSDLKIPANTTIAGQTAPGAGITLRYYTLNINGDNVIVRFIRSRRSQVKNVSDGADAFWGKGFKNIIIDHCSFSWCIDEIASFYDNRDFTMQWCSLSEALANPGHSKGAHSYGGIWGGKSASFHHNMIAHTQNRTPRFNGARYEWSGYDKQKYSSTVDAERVDFRNCLMYNWGTGGCYGGPGGGYINMVNNYYQAGPGTKNKDRVTQVTVGAEGNSEGHPNLWGLCSRYFINGNYVSSAIPAANYDWKGVIYDGGGLIMLDGERWMQDNNHHYGPNADYRKLGSDDYLCVKLNSPIDAGEVTTHDAQTARQKVLDNVGASLYRDAADARYVEECKTGTVTYTGEVAKVAGIVDYINDPDGEQKSNRPSYPVLPSETRPDGWDTDGDGMPDEWETKYGLDPNVANSSLYTLDPQGVYTNLEMYLNSLVEPIMKAGTADAESGFDEYWPVLQHVSGIEDVVAGGCEIERIEYYDLRGIRLDEPAEGISVRRTVYTDGTVVTDKVIKK